MAKHNSDSIQLGEHIIAEPRAITPDRFITKVGRINMKGVLNNRAVNIYECHNETHAAFVHSITHDNKLNSYMPHSYGYHSKFIITEWVSGKQFKPKKLAKNEDYVGQLTTFYKKMHGTKVSKDAGFDYFEDHIHPRFKRCCDTLGLNSFYARITEDYLSLKAPLQTRFLSHPDMTPDNIVVTPHGQIKSIDNELLCTTHLPFFDFFNIIHGFGIALDKNAQLWSNLFDSIKPYMTPEHEDKLLSLWIMRISGSYFVSGRINKILKLEQASYSDLKKSMPLWHTLTTICNSK